MVPAMDARRGRFRWLASRWGPRVALVLGMLVSLPALGVGLVHDDLLHRAALEGHVPGFILPAAGLYDFTRPDPRAVRRMTAYGYLPWFTDPRLVVRFFRPLSSLLLAADVALFGDAALPAHVHSLLWLVMLSVTAAALFRRTLRPTSATFATLVFALAGAHAMTTSWLAARHTLVGATFGAIAVWAHYRFRTEGPLLAAIVAPIALVLGLCASETALGAVVFVALYELIVPRERVARRVLSAAPAFVLGLAYLAFYVLAGYGAHHSGSYVSPLADPLAFARVAVLRGPLLLADLYGAVPSNVAGLVPMLHVPVAVYGLLATGVCAWLLVRADLRPGARRRLLWLGSASIVCLAPALGGVPGPRMLPLAMIGSAAVVGSIIVETWRRAKARSGAARRGLLACVGFLVLVHLGVAPLVRVGIPHVLAQESDAERRLAVEADASACPEGDDAYLLNASDPVLALYAGAAVLFYTPGKAARIHRFRILSMAPEAQVLRVTGEDRFELRAIGPRTATLIERMYRDAPLRVGQVVHVGELTTTVLAIEHGLPTRLAFRDARGLDRACFMVWRGGRLRSFAPPPPGDDRPILHEPGPMGL